MVTRSDMRRLVSQLDTAEYTLAQITGETPVPRIVEVRSTQRLCEMATAANKSVERCDGGVMFSFEGRCFRSAVREVE